MFAFHVPVEELLVHFAMQTRLVAYEALPRSFNLLATAPMNGLLLDPNCGRMVEGSSMQNGER